MRVLYGRLFSFAINYVLANSVQGRTDIGRCVADLVFTDDFALLGVSDSEAEPNLHKIEFELLAEAVGLKICVRKKRIQVLNAKKLGTSVPIAQEKMEITRNHKGCIGNLIEAENQSRLLIGTEVVVGQKNNAGCFQTPAGEKFRMKSSVVSEVVTVSSVEISVVADLLSTANNRSSGAADDEICVCSCCKRHIDTAISCKMHRARFCKSKKSSVGDSASKFVGLVKSSLVRTALRSSRL